MSYIEYCPFREWNNFCFSNSSHTNKGRSNLFFGLASQQNPNSTIEEIDRYINQSVNWDVDPSEWWAQNKSHFPMLAQLARIYLGIPATSTASECSFSTSGNFMQPKRSSLHPSKLNKLCFINENFDNILSKKNVSEIEV